MSWSIWGQFGRILGRGFFEEFTEVRKNLREVYMEIFHILDGT